MTCAAWYALRNVVACALIVISCSARRHLAEPAPSRRILYTSQAPGGTEDVRVLDPASSASTILVSGDLQSARNLAAWSPDSRRIVWIREYLSHDELYVADSVAAAARRLGGNLPGAVMFPDWSPDGTRLAISAGDSASHPGVYLVDVATGVAKALRRDSSNYRCPSWSPRGDRLAVAAFGHARSALLVIDTLGFVRDTIVQSDTTFLDCPQWSPRGDELLFTIFHDRGRSGWERPAYHSNLAIVSLASRRVRTLTHDAGLTNYGRWARDGSWIVFQSDRHAAPATGQDGTRQNLQNLEIWVIRRDGTGLRRLTNNSFFDGHPSW